MKKFLILTLTISIFMSCHEDKVDKRFEVSSNQVGLINKETSIKQLDSIFSNDSIVKGQKGSQFLNTSNEISIYTKSGDKLLIMEAKESSNPDSKIESIQIIDSRYKTATGLSSDSYFKDIKDNYPVSKIESTLSSAVVFVDSINAYFTIDKEELPMIYRGNTNQKIEANNIPDSAKIKHFWVSW